MIESVVRDWRIISLRFVISWIVMLVCIYLSGGVIAEMLLPFMEMTTNFIATHYDAKLSLIDSSDGKLILILATVTRDIYQYNVPIAPTGTQIKASGSLNHMLVSAVIFFTILFAWPTNWKNKIIQVIFGSVMSTILLIITTSLLLAGRIDEMFYNALTSVTHNNYPMPITMNIVKFLEMGGTWLLSVLSAIFCIFTVRNIALINKAKIT